MRCLSCNKLLSDKEATRAYKSTGEYLDLCDHCLEPIKEDIQTIEGANFRDDSDKGREDYYDEEDSDDL